MHEPKTLRDLHREGDGFLARYRTARKTLEAIAQVLELPPETPLTEIVETVRRLQDGYQPTLWPIDDRG